MGGARLGDTDMTCLGAAGGGVELVETKEVDEEEEEAFGGVANCQISKA